VRGFAEGGDWFAEHETTDRAPSRSPKVMDRRRDVSPTQRSNRRAPRARLHATRVTHPIAAAIVPLDDSLSQDALGKVNQLGEVEPFRWN
jgi:hypothetical protein